MRRPRGVPGRALMRFTSPAPEALLTELSRRGMPLRDVSPPADYVFTARVPLGRAAEAKNAARAAGGEAEVLGRGPLAGLEGLRRRLWPALLLLALGFFLLWSEARIWDIEIAGCETVPEGAVRAALAECGVDIGERWVGMSQDAVRNGVILRLPEIRWMTVTMQGSRALVILREKRAAPPVEEEKEFARIAADRAGLVTAVYALRGTAEAGAGRAVLPGETIVGGYATGRFGVQGPVRAAGWAEARTWYELTAAAPADLRQKTYPGGEKTRFSLVFGGKRINFFKGSSICPPGCDKIIKSYALSIPGVFTLPVAVEREILRPYEETAVPAEELPEELEALLRRELERRVGEGEILSAAGTAWEAEGMAYVTLAAECRERIGEAVPLTGEELSAIYARIPKTEE